MRAVAVFPSERSVRVVDRPEPRLVAPAQVRVRVIETGICGTDREICSFHYGTPPRGRDSLVIGHEMLGQVVEIGAGVTSLRAGDFVVPTVRRPCDHAWCVACRSGRQDFCYSGDFTERGIKEADGYNCEQIVDDEGNFLVVPRDLADVAVLVEPLTIAEKALIQIRDVQSRLPWTCPIMSKAMGLPHACHRAVVLGAGPVGLLGAMALRAAGFEVWVYSREESPCRKSEIVEAIGGTYVSAQRMSVSELAAQVGSIDLVYEAVGASSLAFEVLSHLGTNGVFIFTGVPGLKGPISIESDRLMRSMVLRNQVLFGTVNAGRDAFEAALRDLKAFKEKWPGALASLFTSRISIEQAPAKLLDGRGSIKDVVCHAC